MDPLEYEALRRAQEMQKTQNRTHRSQPQQKPQNTQKTTTHTESHTQSSQSQSTVREKPPEPVSPVLSAPSALLFEDKEKLLILVLVMILCNEDNSDPALILALLYIII